MFSFRQGERTGRSGRFFDAVTFDLAVEGAAGDAEGLGRLGEVPVIGFEHPADHRPLDGIGQFAHGTVPAVVNRLINYSGSGMGRDRVWRRPGLCSGFRFFPQVEVAFRCVH